MARRGFSVPGFCAALCAACFPIAPVTADAPSTPEPVEAIWRLHHFEFDFTSSHSRYACGALRAKIGAILQVIGAHRDMAIEVECYRGEVVRHARVRIALAAPVIATEENVLAATKFDTRAQLVAKLNRTVLPTPTDIERFPARWRTVSFSRHRQLRLDAGDCELLHTLRDQVLPKLAVRVTRAASSCSISASRLPPKLEVAALLPLPPSEACCANRPGAAREISSSAITE